MLEKVLVPLDGSQLAECVLPHVVAIAEPFKAQVSLLQVLERPITTGTSPLVDPLDWQLRKVEADSYLATVQTRLEKHQLSAQKHLLQGQAAERILEYAHSNQADLVILSSHGHHGLGRWNVSATVQHILQHVTTSVLLIHANPSTASEAEPIHYRRLLVPLDGSRRAESALPIAARLAEEHEAELLLIHIVTKPEMARRMPPTPEDADLINRFVERNRAEGQKYLEQIQADLPGKVQVRLLIGDNVTVLVQNLVQQEQIDLLILSAHGYSGDVRWAFGSTTFRLITGGTTPVLMVQDLPQMPSDPMTFEAPARHLHRPA